MTTNENIKIRILVVDDEGIITLHLEDILTDLGYDVVGTAYDASEAIEKARELRPDLIFMDIIMPGEKSGIDAANEIKKELNIPIIFLTAFVDDKIIERAKLSEPYSYILKPFNGPDLKVAIEIAMYKKDIEKNLRNSEEMFRTLVEKSRDGVGIIQDGTLIFNNHKLFEILGEPHDINQTLFNSFLSNKFNLMIENINNERSDEGRLDHSNELDIIRKDKSVIPVEVDLAEIEYGGKPAIILYCRDLSKNKDMNLLLNHLITKITICENSLIPEIKNIISITKGQNNRERLIDVLDQLAKCSNNIKNTSRFMQIKYEEKEFIPVKFNSMIDNTISNISRLFPEKDLQINTNINENSSMPFADPFIEDVFLIIMEYIVKYNDSKEIELEIDINTRIINEMSYFEIAFNNPGSWIHNIDIEKISASTIYDDDDEINFGFSIIKYILEKYSGDIRIDNSVKDDDGKCYQLKISLPIIKPKL